MKKIRWGVLSTADIGIKQVIPAMQKGHCYEVVGISSRKLDSAKTKAVLLGIPKAYGSYEALLEDPDIDAIYNPLPNHLHVPWTIKALEAGKHVLCEKPIALTKKEAEELLVASQQFPHLKVMEAFMYRFHPQWQKAKSLATSGAIGKLLTIQSFFSYFLDDPTNIRNIAEIGGGGLMDIGCYSISLSRFIFGKEPTRVCSIMEYDPEFKTDFLSSAMMDFGNGTSTFSCGTKLVPYQSVNIFGSLGRIEIEIPFNPSPDKTTRMWVHLGNNSEEIKFDNCDQYTIQGELFSEAILKDTPVPTSLKDAVANIAVIDAIVKSSKERQWISL
jgi:predicted dehydrogenase